MTLLQILERRAREETDNIAFTFHNDPPCTYGNLWQKICDFSGRLIENGLKSGTPVIIAIPNSSQFFHAFYGVQGAGGIAVPVFPGSGAGRITKLADLCDAAFYVVSQTFPPDKTGLLAQHAKEKGGAVLLVENGSHDARSARGGPFPEIEPDDTAFVQFTSGSVGDPKGVRLTHADLVTNIEQMIAGMEITKADVFISWLPVYHDMGLILMTMVPFYLGLELVLLPAGLNYLKSWLKLIHERGGTFTAAPDFAYRMCLLYIRDPENYDLSTMRTALNAAEPVRSGTIQRFEERFGLKNVLLPAYGLAEATVGVCSWRPGKEIKVDGRGFVSVGKPFPGVEMRIMGEDQPAKPGETGELLVRSKANTRGYCHNPDATKALFDEEGYIRTGDLGYMDEEGDFYIVGRKKNIIIQGGFNIAAGEVQELVDEFSFVRRSAAVGIDRGSNEGEQVYIFIEVNLKRSELQNPDVFEDITIRVVGQFDHTFGFKPGRVCLLKPGSIPMTYNGKIKYVQLKEFYINGTLRENGSILFPRFL
ncbi:MAG: fatty acyl-AMP ligase [bacterium]|nr:fatty acyl-AMP ligase [bacterium]